MKRAFAVLLCGLLLFILAVPVFAEDTPEELAAQYMQQVGQIIASGRYTVAGTHNESGANNRQSAVRYTRDGDLVVVKAERGIDVSFMPLILLLPVWYPAAAISRLIWGQSYAVYGDGFSGWAYPRYKTLFLDSYTRSYDRQSFLRDGNIDDLEFPQAGYEAQAATAPDGSPAVRVTFSSQYSQTEYVLGPGRLWYAKYSSSAIIYASAALTLTEFSAQPDPDMIAAGTFKQLPGWLGVLLTLNNG